MHDLSTRDPRSRLAELHKANVGGILPEAAAADVEAVLADDTATVVAHAAAARAGSVLLRVGVVRVRHLGAEGALNFNVIDIDHYSDAMCCCKPALIFHETWCYTADRTTCIINTSEQDKAY